VYSAGGAAPVSGSEPAARKSSHVTASEAIRSLVHAAGGSSGRSRITTTRFSVGSAATSSST